MACDDDDATSSPLPPDRKDHSTSKSSESTPVEDDEPKVEEVDETEVDETEVQPTAEGQSSSDKEEEDEVTFISLDASRGKLIFDLDYILKSLRDQPELLKFLVFSYEQFKHEGKGLHENRCRVSSVLVWFEINAVIYVSIIQILHFVNRLIDTCTAAL